MCVYVCVLARVLSSSVNYDRAENVDLTPRIMSTSGPRLWLINTISYTQEPEFSREIVDCRVWKGRK